MSKEKILCAAVYLPNVKSFMQNVNNIESGTVICGYRHDNCFVTIRNFIKELEINKSNCIAGFLTTKNNFYNRNKSCKIAVEAGQVDENFLKYGSLTSEDVW